MRAGGLAILAALALAIPSPAVADQPKDFTVIGKTVKSEIKGDRAAFKERLYDGIKGPRNGVARYRCHRTGKTSRCHARFDLRDGTVRAGGKVGEVRLRVPGENKASTLRIRGGTGRYRDARGTLLLNGIAKRLSQLRFDFR